jgi:hypothetical protein
VSGGIPESWGMLVSGGILESWGILVSGGILGPGELLGPVGDSGVHSEYLYGFWGTVGSIEYSRKGYTFHKGVPGKRPGRLGSKGDNGSQGHTGV